MPYKIDTSKDFRKEAKRLSKKYISLKSELATLGEILKENPTLGTHLGNDCYKIRISIASKNKGKSGGGRVITFVYAVTETCSPFTTNRRKKTSQRRNWRHI